MPNIIKTSLNTRSLLLCLFIMTMGISAGIFFGGIVPEADINNLTSVLHDLKPQFFPTLFINLSALLLIALAGFTVYGFPVAHIILFSRSFAVGFCDCLLLYNIDSNGTSGFIFSFLLPQLMLCSIYFLIAAISTGYALSQIKK